MNYFVEVTVWSGGTLITKHEPTDNWNSAMTKAQQMAVAMFPEDPMSNRTFRSGRYMYTNVNDFGEPVVIRPVASEVDLRTEMPVSPSFILSLKELDKTGVHRHSSRV